MQRRCKGVKECDGHNQTTVWGAAPDTGGTLSGWLEWMAGLVTVELAVSKFCVWVCSLCNLA